MYRFFLMIPRPPTSALFPYTTLFRSRRPPTHHRPTDAERRRRRPPTHHRVTRQTTPTQRERAHHGRSEEHTSELQSRQYLVCRLLIEKNITISYAFNTSLLYQ